MVVYTCTLNKYKHIYFRFTQYHFMLSISRSYGLQSNAISPLALLFTIIKLKQRSTLERQIDLLP